MKFRFLFLVLLQLASWGSQAHAMPVLNENQSLTKGILIYADSVDANYYYYVPESVGLCKDDHGKFQFSFSLVKTGGMFSRRNGLLEAVLCVKDNSQAMAAAMAAILVKNPNAKFGAMPFESSQVIFDSQTAIDVSEASGCNHGGGQVGQREDCSILFKPASTPGVLRRLNRGGIIGMHFVYAIQGVDRYPAGLQPKTLQFAVAADIFGTEFHGQLRDYVQR